MYKKQLCGVYLFLINMEFIYYSASPNKNMITLATHVSPKPIFVLIPNLKTKYL